MSALFHSPSKKMVQRFCTAVGRKCACLKKETTFSNVSGFKLAAASCCLVGAVRRVLLTKKAMIVSQVFMYLRERIWAARVHGSGTTCLAGHGFFHLTPGISRRGHWKRRPPFSFTAQ